MGGAFLYYSIAKNLPSSTCPVLGRFFNSLRRVSLSSFLGNIDNKCRIESNAYFGVNNEVKIGQNSGIGKNFHLQGCNLTIGKYVMMAPNVTIIGNGHIIDSVDIPMIKQGVTPKGCLLIEDDVWIGRGVTILPGCHCIGKGSVIGACAVVTKNVPPYEIWASNPAHCIKRRK